MENTKNTKIPVSVIVPVYNVYDYLDECMESLVKQTFPDFELILINDGSTDGSETKCQEWAARDSRIRLISKENEGLSPTRNDGLAQAIGDYIVFVDADDWVDVTFIEKLYDSVKDSPYGMAECDVYRYNDKSGKKTYRSSFGPMGKKYTLEEHMKYGYTAIWKCMVKREIYTRHNISFPCCHSPARAIYALLLAVCGGIENVQEPLYYYRMFRAGSLTQKPRANDGDEEAPGIRAFEELLQGFQRRNLYQEYESLLEETVKYKLSDLLAGFFTRYEKYYFCQIAKNYYDFMGRTFPKSANFKYITFGGYNLNRIMMHLNILHNPYDRFNFSSIISVMHPLTELIELSHKNVYRKIMIERDLYSDFWKVMQEESPEYIFMDFLEERFDIFRYEDAYITKSDAFDGAEFETCGMELIARGSEECSTLWKEICLAFIAKISEEFPTVRVVLIKNYLCEQFGDMKKQEAYPEAMQIKETNKILKDYYLFFEQHCKNLISIEAVQCEPYITDINYEYGTVPSHLNELANEEIAERIKRSIGL